MANNFCSEPRNRECAEFHRVDPKRFADKSALKDALACGLTIRCVKCAMTVNELPEMAVAVFGSPPKWFLRVIRNAAKELVVIDTPKRS